MITPDSRTGVPRYFVSHNGEVKGPFDLDMIEAFVLSGHYPRGVQICAVESTEWQSYSPPIPTSPAPVPRQSGQPAGAKSAAGVPKWIFIVGGVFALIVLSAVFNSTPSKTSPASSSTGSAGAYGQSQAYQPGIDANGRTYRVPHSDYQRLSNQKRALEQEDAMVRGAQTEWDAEASTLERQRAYLDHTNQYEIYDFNAKIDALNAKKFQLQRQIATFNNHVDAFNAELARVGTPSR